MTMFVCMFTILSKCVIHYVLISVDIVAVAINERKNMLTL